MSESETELLARMNVWHDLLESIRKSGEGVSLSAGQVEKLSAVLGDAIDRRSADGVKVRELEWEEIAATDHIAKSIIGEYSIVGSGNSWSLHIPGRVDRDYFDTLAGAKAAAQSDYESRIKSALDLGEPV